MLLSGQHVGWAIIEILLLSALVGSMSGYICLGNISLRHCRDFRCSSPLLGAWKYMPLLSRVAIIGAIDLFCAKGYGVP